MIFSCYNYFAVYFWSSIMKKKWFAVLTAALINAFFSLGVFADEVSKAVHEKSDPNIFGKIVWVVIALGVIFVIYLLITIPRKKNQHYYVSGEKYRRSPYKKNGKRIAQVHYYNYKRNKYDKKS